jgi:hypothetical protein
VRARMARLAVARRLSTPSTLVPPCSPASLMGNSCPPPPPLPAPALQPSLPSTSSLCSTTPRTTCRHCCAAMRSTAASPSTGACLARVRAGPRRAGCRRNGGGGGAANQGRRCIRWVGPGEAGGLNGALTAARAAQAGTGRGKPTL